jgi:hypothetical protein
MSRGTSGGAELGLEGSSESALAPSVLLIVTGASANKPFEREQQIQTVETLRPADCHQDRLYLWRGCSMCINLAMF